jgi:DNA-binding response OmpR family regulator
MSRVDPPNRKWNALIVDDDRGLQGLFLTLLGREGFAVDSAPNGRIAFDYLRRRSYSVVLLDLMMPDVNGFELLERLERDSPLMVRRVIILTGASQREVEQAGAHRVWDVIRKPFDIHELVGAARRCAEGDFKRAAPRTQPQQQPHA